MRFLRIINRIAAPLLAFALMQGCQMQQQVTFRAQLVKAPVATRQLDPAVFVPKHVIRKLHINEGDPVQVTYQRRALQVRIYDIWREGNIFALHKNFADSLGLTRGQTYPIRIRALRSGETHLTPRPIRTWVENYHGQKENWQKIALGAPHGDCDMKTGDIVKIVSQQFGIPATAGYGARLSYRGIWFDMNRPLMKLPKKGGGVFRERVWNRKAEQVYHMYQDSVWRNSGLRFGQRFRLFSSFHGHDLTVRLKNGKVIQRPVIEAMGVGFRKTQLRKIKDFYNRHKTEYYTDPPQLVFGNLPEDRVYTYQGIPLTFFYSGLGTRVYGSLRSDLVRHALHMETPNSMRLDPAVRPKTARFLHDLYRFILDSVLAEDVPSSLPKNFSYTPRKGKRWIKIDGGTFDMGAPKNVGWASEHPQHRVRLKGFHMASYEVTNQEYADFLNSALKEGRIVVEQGVVKNARNPEEIWFRSKEAAPMSQIEFRDQSFFVQKGKAPFPVIYVSWYGAQAYAQFYGWRLPSEAEWEMAASWDARKNRKYIYAYASDRVDAAKANFEDSGDPSEAQTDEAQTVPVGYYAAKSPAGAYNMGGNVMEWCADFYDYGFYKKAPKGVWENPLCTEEKTMRTVRGGAWNLEPWIGRTTFRLGIHPNATLVNVGFRCAKE